MHTYPENDAFLDHNMKLFKMIEIYLKYDNMHTIGVINAFICIDNHVNACYHIDIVFLCLFLPQLVF